MTAGPSTPEDLEASFEDAFVMRDAPALCSLFEAGGVLVPGPGSEARGEERITRAAAAMWRTGRTYVGSDRRVVQARDSALVVGDAGIHVVRRSPDGSWRIAIALLGTTTRPAQEDP